MLAALVLLTATQAPAFAPPHLWAAGFAAPPRIPLVGDVDADGYGDLICVYPPGAAIIDVSLSEKGQKAGVPFQALTGWGKDCQAAIAGEFDDKPGADVAGLFGGDTVRLAGGFENGKYKDVPDWVKLPRRLREPRMSLAGGKILISSRKDRVGFAITPATRAVSPWRAPVPPPFDPKAWGLRSEKTSQWLTADMDRDGDEDVVEFRYGTARHTAHDILVYRRLTPGEKDSDADGLANEEETKLGTDALNPDTDNDGLLDGWETGNVRDLDLKALGCDPRRIDLICLISRYSNVDENHVKKELERVTKSFAELDVANPNGSKGFSFHPVFLDPVPEKDHPNPWWTNRDKYRPAKWKGLVHWMQITPGGGGQADQMGDAGSCGANALWAVFMHEFGHQIGMDHHGFWEPGLCPIYTSMMNYAYSYGFEDDGAKIHYSHGRFKEFVLDERNLNETLPFPYERVKFLEKGPYRFRLKPKGNATLVDWNWNGVFGEKGIRADINYSYSTNAGTRDDVGKAMTSPWLFVHEKKAWIAYGRHEEKADPKIDPTISPDRPGDLYLRGLVEPRKWKSPIKINGPERLAGDPVAASKDGWVFLAYPAKGIGLDGVVIRRLRGAYTSAPMLVPGTTSATVPTLGVSKDRLYLFLWNPATGDVTYHTLGRNGRLSPAQSLGKSTIPVGMALDPIRREVILGAAGDQDKARPSRWQIRRYEERAGTLVEKRREFIEGEAGGSRGYGRATVLFDASREAGPNGRIYFFGRGLTTKETPWSCTYVAHEIADKSVRGGWLVKRFYDEWTQTRSAPAAAWFDGDIIWAYRWVDGGQGTTDNNLHVGYRALGIDDKPMGDHDDLTFFKQIGIRRSILYVGSG